MELEKLTEFPSTRYYGSKRKHLDWIHKHIKDLDFTSVLDAFGGSASVSLLLSKMGKDVTYNDYFKFNSICADVVLNINSRCLIDEAIRRVDEIRPTKGFVCENFRGIYFTDEENAFIDGFVEYSRKCNSEVYKIITYGLIQACLSKRPYNLFHRANLYMRTNDASRSFGNLSTWNKPFDVSIKSFLWELYSLGSYSESKIVCKDVHQIDGSFDAIYLDPPYVSSSRSTESYATRYHFLEGLVNPSEWESWIDYKTKPRKFRDGVYSKEWTSKSKCKDLLFSLIEKYKSSTVILSYCDEAVPSIDEILEFYKSLFSDVELHYKYHRYSLSKRDRNEVIFIGR